VTWKSYIAYGEKYEYEEHATIFMQGERGKGFYYLDKGNIINRFLSINGKERYMNHISPGMLFGEEGSNGSNYLSNAETLEPSSVYFFTEQTLLDICQKDPDAVTIFIRHQVESFRKKLQVIQLLDSNIESQMKLYLLHYAGESTEIPFNQTRIADDLATSRVTVNKIVQKWQNQRLIKLEKQKIHLLDRDNFFSM